MDERVKILASRYELGGIIGRGGMAEVHIGHDRRLGRTVAIKVLRSDLARDPSFQNRFKREAQAAASLNHPAIVAVYDTGEDAGEAGGSAHVPFIVMEYVEGHTVRDMLHNGQPLPLDEAIDITIGVLSALEYSHQAGIVHRDIKPANVMLTPAGAIKVMDFGIARAMADSAATMTQTQAVVGTAQYLSPEQARGEQVDTRSDLYSTGCLLFELLAGRPPFMADSMVAVAYQHVREQPPLSSSMNPTVPDSLDRIVHKALAKDRETRYQTAAEFRADLEALQRGTRVMAPPVRGASAGFAATQVMTPMQTGSTSVLPPPQNSPWQSTGLAPEAAKSEDVEPSNSKRWLIVLLAAIGLIAIGAIIVFALNNQGNGTKPVPDVTNKSETEAVSILEKAGFKPVKETIADAEVPEGSVVNTDPPAEELAPEGSEVKYFVSTGPGNVTVPNVLGKSAEQAAAELEAAGLKVSANQIADDNAEYDKGEVTKTDPAVGQEVDQDQEITLYVSTGRVELKDVVGLTQADAEQLLRGLKLTVTIKEEESDRPVGEVISMSPAAKTVVAQGSSVTITVAAAPQSGVVPSGLIGLTYDDAVSRLKNAQFTGDITKQTAPSETVPLGQVISTNPSAGTKVPLNQPFTITVSSGFPSPTPSPTH